VYIKRLQLQNIRNITEVELEPSPQINVFIGPNASGKTAILEAIHLLSCGKSFRTSRMKELLQHTKTSMVVRAALQTKPKITVKTAIEKQTGKTTILYNGNVVRKQSEQAKNIPLLLVVPDSHRLITGEPKLRRHWLDWAMFHVKPNYIDTWKDYHKSLRHRNALLKKGGDAGQLLAWEQSMSLTAQSIHKQRLGFIEKISEEIKNLLSGVGWEVPDIIYVAGWDTSEDLLTCLINGRNSDRELGFTRAGIHRADITFKIQGHSVASQYSRGQIKKYLACLVIAQMQVMEKESGKRPIFLIDDFAAELDEETRQKLLLQLINHGSQVFITSTELDRNLSNIAGLTVFHVEHGDVNKVVE
jgi:DNA replication and repair protein RecF